jgi:predicted GNAT superfamily acetyltransferase
VSQESVRELAHSACARAGIRIDVLHGSDQVDAAREVCDAVWPTLGGGSQVTNNLLTAIEHSGGYVSAAYDLRSRDANPVAAVISLVGRHRDDSGVWESHLHSHMAAVTDSVRDRGVGTAIKFDQRAWAAEQDIPLIGWTFDPLVRRNAWLNLVKLGATVHEYLPNFYGLMDDELNSGDESDRLYVWWSTAAAPSGAPIDEVSPDEVVVELPDDIVSLRNRDRAAAMAWRTRVREAMSDRLQSGWSVRGMTREGFYVLTQRESHD